MIRLAPVLADLRSRLADWMERTDDPLRHGPVPLPPGAVANSVDQVSAEERTRPDPVAGLPDPRRDRGGHEVD